MRNDKTIEVKCSLSDFDDDKLTQEQLDALAHRRAFEQDWLLARKEEGQRIRDAYVSERIVSSGAPLTNNVKGQSCKPSPLN